MLTSRLSIYLYSHLYHSYSCFSFAVSISFVDYLLCHSMVFFGRGEGGSGGSMGFKGVYRLLLFSSLHTILGRGHSASGV